jgi:AraC-like DNA-binding protein
MEQTANQSSSTSTFGQANTILCATSRRHAWSGVGALSIKTFRGGRAHYTTGHGYHAVDDEVYLVLNQGQPYSIAVDSDAPVESFCVFFADGLAAQVRHSLSASDARLLDAPEPPAAAIEFFDRTYAHDHVLSPALARMRELARRPYEQSWLDEQFHDLMTRLLHIHQRALCEVAHLPAARPATRAELYRRLHLARDYIDATYAGPLRLADLARTAGLSPNHLLRTFRQLFQLTPYQYITGRRLELARRLLAETELPISEICLAVGFESLGSFSWLFRRKVGVAPSEYRRLHQRSREPRTENCLTMNAER